MSPETRAYGKLRDIVERRGGTMVWHRAGYRYGAREISLDGTTVIVETMGVHSFPELDRFYVPAPEVGGPRTWDDYEHDLIHDAESQLIAWILADWEEQRVNAYQHQDLRLGAQRASTNLELCQIAIWLRCLSMETPTCGKIAK